MTVVTAVVVLGGCSSPDGSAGERSSAPTSSATSPVGPLYYAFAFDARDDATSGCGPQGRFVRIVGDQFYEVAADGCDWFADRGVIEGDQVSLRGVVVPCLAESTASHPTTMEITGGPNDLRIPGETRVVGPTDSIQDLDAWFAEENERIENPIPRNATQITERMALADEEDWVGSGC